MTGAVDSPFTTLVLGLEQAKLDAQAPKASLILSKEGELLTYDAYLQAMGRHLPRDGVMLNAYPDSLDGTLAGLAIGITLAVIHIVGIQVTGVSVNPARSFGPAVLVGGQALSQLWLFFVAPAIGAVIAGAIYRFRVLR